jgi:hypothetical protein
MASSPNPPESPGQPQGRVRWRRFALMLVPSLGAAGALIGLTASGVLASSISVSGQSFTVTAKTLQGTGFAQYGSILQTAKGPKPVAVSVIQGADLTNLCQSVTTPTPVGNITLRLTAGDNGTPAHADNMVVAADQLSGDATFHHIVIGQDAGQLGAGGVTPPPTNGGFGQMASDVTISNLNQNTWLTTAGTFSLPNLSLSFGNPC